MAKTTDKQGPKFKPDPKKYDKLLLELSNLKHHEDINAHLKLKYPNLDFLDGKNNKTAYIRSFIPWYIIRVNKETLKNSFGLIDKIYKNLYTNNSTLDSILSKDVRKPVVRKYKEGSEMHKQSKYLVKISYNDKKELIKQGADNVYQRNQNRLEFENKDVLEIISKGKTGNFYELGISMLLASGSRPIELFSRSSYTISKEGDNWITQNYIAKRKEDVDKPVIKPLINYTAVEFIQKLKILREELIITFTNIENDRGELSSTISAAFNRSMKKLFNYRDNITLYTCRKLYGKISYEMFSKVNNLYGTNPEFHVWLNNVLGHNKKSIEIAANYTNIDLTKYDLTPEGLAIRQDILDNKIEEVMERVEILHLENEDEISRIFSGKVSSKIMLSLFEKLKVKFDQYYRDNQKIPTQTDFETLLVKDITTRTNIRLFYKEYKKSIKNQA